ncbi:MAG TPA: sigma-70 family RNA polymerase sigma factor [Candidatus Sulfopaludibacter sp.]|nr:sigma-70 family RNA polymerase sigma factor [Candidatus Sulfopaludibacter sp.]
MADAHKLARFERALLPHLDAAHNLARWLLGNAPDAEDAVQDAFVRALTFFDSFHGEDGRGWLLAIIRNTCYDWLRKNRRTAEVAGAAEELERAADGAPGPEAAQLRRADERRVRQGLESLPAEYREALVLREMEGLSYKQIAQVAGVPIGTVMSRLARGRKRLAAALEEAP